MVVWIVVALVVVPFVLLGLAARPVLTSVRRLRRAAVALQRHAGAAAELQTTAAALQVRAEELQARAANAQQQIAAIRSRRGG
ncbi:hypothetical protein HCB17_08055 [Salinispora arenicola]|uniref:Uncharacterized protein n=1 Tax=Salinispora arenicola (strain CNS-205) TaxID=391037 RepID=A8M2B1_SALAI|nr:hypothetical protein [Salinispora arenicola]MCN0178893.1 hypothetical protein [Salinispora arenicola]NIL41130.1 hypothetical protein [Salinispora arenicola]NIL62372.1 hypothetical protein [Salinispora arenicola]